jgi:hypothetical protein
MKKVEFISLIKKHVLKNNTSISIISVFSAADANYRNLSNLSFFTLQIGQTSGGCTLAHK